MASNYPLTGFHFSVRWNPDDEENISFSEVSGLNVTAAVIEYREGSDPEYTTLKMPGLKKYSNVTLKRGSMAADNGFFEWFKDMMRIRRKSSPGASRTRSLSNMTQAL